MLKTTLAIVEVIEEKEGDQSLNSIPFHATNAFPRYTALHVDTLFEQS